MSYYDDVGGAPTFEKLVQVFYREVARDEPLRALYPEEDLGPAERRLRLFLEQYFGGPNTYSQERGHPMLRARHVPYVIDTDQRDRWLRAMFTAMDEVELPPAHAEAMRNYFVRAADMLINAPD